jgi:superfamily II DNA or RNA helicase
MSLKDIDNKIQSTYDTGFQSKDSQYVLENFWEPVLKESNYLFRGVAYFTSGGLLGSIKGLKQFLSKPHSKINLLVGLQLQEKDYHALEKGLILKEEIDESIIKKWHEICDEMDNESIPSASNYRLKVLKYLIAVDIVELRFVHKKQGDYHNKYALISDGDDSIVISGSNNESQNAIWYNSENFTVHKSWHAESSPEKHYDDIEKNCKDWWDGNGLNNAKIYSAPQAIKENCIKRIDDESITREQLINYEESEDEPIYEAIVPKIPSDYKLRKYQKNALNNFFKQDRGFRGIFKHCTAAGKTFTSIFGMTQYFESNYKKNKEFKMCSVISVEYEHLAEMWKDELEEFSWNPIICSSQNPKWRADLEKKINNFKTSDDVNSLSIIVLNASLVGQKFSKLLGRLDKKDVFFIGDECHHHISRFKKIPSDFKFMLGLSATPENPYDELLSDELINDFYGGICDEFPIERGLTEKDPKTGKTYLTPFEYHIHKVILNESENDKFMKLSAKLIKKVDENGNPINNEAILNERAMIISNAQNKLDVLSDLIKDVPEKDKFYTIIYSGMGGAPNEETDSDDNDDNYQEAQIDEICKILKKNNWTFSKYTSKSLKSKESRKTILDEFEKGKNVQAIIAMKCLDEGLNIPKIRTAFITASNRYERQFIQRAGRILRREDTKDKAIIHDFFVFPFNQVNLKDSESNHIIAELGRVKWFSELSLNKKETTDKIKDWSNDYPSLN